MDPSINLKESLSVAVSGHFAATLDPVRLGAILRAFDEYAGTLPVTSALQLMPLLFVRPGELRRAEWSNFNFEKAEWRFEVSKTAKTGVKEHIVPLSTQALHILRELRPVTGFGRFLFPSERSSKRPMSDIAVLAAMRRMHITKEEMSGHGFRAVARTLLDEELHFRPDLIEHQLAHKVRDTLGRAYNRTTHLAECRSMMQSWADYLDKLKGVKEQVVFHATA